VQRGIPATYLSRTSETEPQYTSAWDLTEGDVSPSPRARGSGMLREAATYWGTLDAPESDCVSHRGIRRR
jgi:hypothetical protein